MAVTRIQRELAQGDAASRVKVGRRDVLHDPAGSDEEAIDLLPRDLLRVRQALAPPLIDLRASVTDFDTAPACSRARSKVAASADISPPGE